jgi:DNA-binding MarR family transcriptional regulator
VTTATTPEEDALWPPARGRRSIQPAWQSVHGAYHALRIRIQQALADFCLEASEAFVLVYVSSSPGCSPGEIRRALGFHRSTLSSLLGRLESEGLLRRAAPPFDGRRLMIDLTATGESMASTVRSVLLDVEEELSGWTSPTDRRGAEAVFAACQAMVRSEDAWD